MKIITLSLGMMPTNCYIISSGSDCAVIDPAAEAEKIINEARENGLRIEKILLTHSHFDHIGALGELAEKTGAGVYLGKNEQKLLISPSLNLSEMTGLKIVYTGKTNGLSDGDTVSVGSEKVTVYETPGHTVGSVCYKTDDAVFCGDTIFRTTVGRTDFPTGSFESIISSGKRILSLPDKTVLYPGHNDMTNVGFEKQNNPYFIG